MEDLLNKAKALGIENAESFTKKDLEKLVAKAVTERTELLVKAEKLDIETEGLEGYTNDEIKQAISEFEAGKNEEIRKEEIISFLEQTFEISLDDASISEVKAAVLSKLITATEKADDTDLGKTDAVFEVLGSKYRFAEKAPSKFRFADTVKTQLAWLDDPESLELMVHGGVSYLKKID